MSRTFGEDLELFAEAVRTIRQPDFEAILRTVKDYLSSSLSVSKIEVVRRQSRGHDLVLVPVIDKSDPYGAYGLFDQEGRPNGQDAFSYIKQRNLWIISSGEEETLAKSKIYVDQWSDSHADEIPTFVRFEENKRHRGDERTRTLICIPVYKKNITAVVYYESEKRLEFNGRAMNEFEAISNAMALLERKAARNSQDHEVTLNAINGLAKLAEPDDFFGEAPLVFFGYSERSDEIIVDQIRESIKAFGVNPIDWEAKVEPGDIRARLYKDLMRVRAGVFYFSERDENSESKESYKDNVNVIFEAGMLQTRYLEGQLATTRRSSGMPFLGWVGIRERIPSSLPFDIAGERILYVRRLANHKVASEEFGEKLTQSLVSLLGPYR